MPLAEGRSDYRFLQVEARGAGFYGRVRLGLMALGEGAALFRKRREELLRPGA
jgi:hypothetical protein